MVQPATITPLYTLAGLAVGMMVGLTGVGGGSLMTPLLVLVFGISPATAVGTDLLHSAVTQAVGAGVHGAHGSVDWRVVRRLASGSVPATVAMLLLLAALGTRRAPSQQVISTVLGLAVLLTALMLLARGWLLRVLGSRLTRLAEGRATALTIAAGAVLGALVTLSSVGAGAVGVTALILLYPQFRTARIVGSDMAHTVPLTLLAGTGHWMLGSVDWHLLVSLLSGSVPGIVIGSLVAVRVPDRVIRPLLACVLLAVGGRLVF